MFKGTRQILQKHGGQKQEKTVLFEPELLPLFSAEELLSSERRQQLLKVLPSLSQLPSKEYQSLYLRLIQHYAEFVQQLPETKNGYYPY